MSQLGALRTLQGKPEQGLSYSARSWRARRQAGSPDLAIDLQWLGRQRETLGDARFEHLVGEVLKSETGNLMGAIGLDEGEHNGL
jgi:hypothetical protein